MKSSPELLKFVESWEGCVLTPYMDAGGRLTVGIGHLLQPGDKVEPITEQQALFILAIDIRIAQNAVNDLVEIPLTQTKFDALCSFVFNIGRGNFTKSHLLRFLNQGNLTHAADAFLAWNHAGGKVLDGLMRRRKAERDLFLTGIYQNNGAA